jgi:NADH-quinone oxidoreductase subunit J
VVAQNVAFWILAVALALAAIGVVRSQNIVHAALYLVVVLAGAAAQYILVAAEFVAWVQVLIYIGAIVILFLFGIMLTRAPMRSEGSLDNTQRWGPRRRVALPLRGARRAARRRLRRRRDPPHHEARVGRHPATSPAIFRDYLVPFEVVSMLLLAALVGAVVIARRD